MAVILNTGASLQLLAIAVTAVASFGWMATGVIRLFTRRASVKATTREASALESALVGATVPEGARAFDAWSYRVGARFAGRVRVVVRQDLVSVAGPRVPSGLYRVWIACQALLLAAVAPALVAAMLLLDWRWAVAAVAIFVVSWAISMGGAGVWPGLGELDAVETGHFKALEFPRAAVKEVDGGRGWSKGGLGIVLFPYKAGVDAMAGVRAVSFFAPDEQGHEVRFAVHMTSDSDARELATLLQPGSSGTGIGQNAEG